MARSRKLNSAHKRKSTLRRRASKSARHMTHPCGKADEKPSATSVCAQQSCIEDKVLHCLTQLKNFVCRRTAYSPSRAARVKNAMPRGVHRNAHHKPPRSCNPLLSKRKQQIARRLFNVIDDALEYGETNDILKRSDPSVASFKRAHPTSDTTIDTLDVPRERCALTPAMSPKRMRLDKPKKREHGRLLESSLSDFTT